MSAPKEKETFSEKMERWNDPQTEVVISKEWINCHTRACWIVQILIWICMFLTSLLWVNINYIYYLIPMCVLIGPYVWLELWSPHFQSLRNLYYSTSPQDFIEKMEKIYQTPPKIIFSYKCIEGVEGTLISYQIDKEFLYYSARDLSGLFYFNCEDESIKNKSYVLLDIEAEINFADNISYLDYDTQKKEFIRENISKASAIIEYRNIPDLKRYNLLKLKPTEPRMVSYVIFWIFIIIPFAELYKLYLNSLIVEKKIKIRKIISTRYDLNQPVYQKFNPQLNLVKNLKTYDPNYKNENYELHLPTEQELEKAKIYEDKIPHYELMNGENGNIIIDNPSYSIYGRINIKKEIYKNDENNTLKEKKEYEPPVIDTSIKIKDENILNNIAH